MKDGRVTGVAYECDGTMREARAGEVILCGGAINTPQLLMLSGIGDGERTANRSASMSCWTGPPWDAT